MFVIQLYFQNYTPFELYQFLSGGKHRYPKHTYTSQFTLLVLNARLRTIIRDLTGIMGPVSA